MDKNEREAIEKEFDFEQSRENRIKALGKLMEAKDSINEAIDHERNDDNIGVESVVLVSIEGAIKDLSENLFNGTNGD